MYSKLSVLFLVPCALLTACDKKDGAGAAASATPAAAPVDSAAVMRRTLASAEAKAHVIAITRGVMAAAMKEEMPGDTLPMDDEPAKKKLPESAKAVPASADDVKGKAYTSKAADWESWKAIGFKIGAPQQCQYEWTREKDTDGFASAKCDFDGDGKLDFHVKQAVTILNGTPKVGLMDEVIPLGK